MQGALYYNGICMMAGDWCRYKENQGLAAAFNTLYFNLCADYEFVLTLEEDWWYNRLQGSGQLDYDTMLKLLPDDTEERLGFDDPNFQVRHLLDLNHCVYPSVFNP